MKHFLVFNRTDGILANPRLMTLEEAEVFIRDFPKRYQQQGYYLTASRQRIPAEAVDLEIVDEEMNPVGFGE